VDKVNYVGISIGNFGISITLISEACNM